MVRKVVAFLQNAWSTKYAGRRWPYRAWLSALWRSRTGRRLLEFVSRCPGVEIRWENTTLEVGGSPDSAFPVDEAWIRQVLIQQAPTHVLAFGKKAAEGVMAERRRCFRELAGVPVMLLPHPASRVLTNELLYTAGEMLAKGFHRVVELKQGRGKVTAVYSWRQP